MSAEPQPSAMTDDAPTAAVVPSGAERAPLAFIVDNEASIRQFISLILQGNNVDTMEFADCAALRNARSARPPDLVFINVNIDAQDAIQSVEALGKVGFSGAVQLISGREAVALDSVMQVGEKFRLRMLPPLKKPFETPAIQTVIFDLKLGRPPAKVKIELAEALKNNWIEFWYQPKIDLKKKQLAGAEAFARVRHPQHGVLPPSNFMAGADDAALLTLAEQSLVSALKSGLNLSRLGVNLRMAINASIGALTKLPVGDIVRVHRPKVTNWPGIIVDITEQQVVSDISQAIELSRKFSEHNVRLAVDDFGKNYAPLSKLKEMPFAEMKLDRAIVTDKAHAAVCKTVIDLAHGFGSLAVGIGLENASEAVALIGMGCDLGQGFLFGQPMPEERFISLLKQRATVRAAAAPAGAPAAALKRA